MIGLFTFPLNSCKYKKVYDILRSYHLNPVIPSEDAVNQPSNVVNWTDRDFEAITTTVESRPDAELLVDHSVIAALELAFKRRVPRQFIWDLSALSPVYQAVMGQAALIYKRGVSVRGQKSQVSNQLEINGKSMAHERVDDAQSLINVVANIDLVFADFESRDLLIVDENVAKYWWHRLPTGFLTVAFSERQKSIDLVNFIGSMVSHRKSCTGRIFVVGGGVAGDVCGFVAGLMRRQWVFVPSTLLAMVDSSIGGKVGVNFSLWGKNQVGLFYPPVAVRIWSGWVETLVESELRSGLAEAYKHALLSGSEVVRRGVVSAASVVNDSRSLAVIVHPFIGKTLSVKLDIVTRDLWESGERVVLNLGHTVGHALETIALEDGFDVSHGECVAIGIFCALRLSVKYANFCASDILQEILELGLIPNARRLCECWGAVEQFAAKRQRFMSLLLTDKKNFDSETIRFVLLAGPGCVAKDSKGSWTIPVPMNDVWDEVLMVWSQLTNDSRVSEK